MVFSSTVFLLLFLPIVFIGNILIKKEYSNYFLLLASLFFYAWGEPYLVLLMMASVLLNWSIGLALNKYDGRKRKIYFVFGIVCDLCILGYYKYAGFIATTINCILHKKLFHVIDMSLPIGISFFTFQAISYIADVYRCDTKASNNFVNVALYISFFPQLIAGPIVKYRDINTQIEKREIRLTDFSDGFKRFIYGLGKKVLIANVLGMCVDTIYGFDIARIDFGAAWIGAIAYTLQIYYDFSGYSDMAIGLGKMFGFNILENFDYPYLSHSISEFWRKWHISLGSWFREYLYIPLGGNRKGQIRTYVNLVIVFCLTGLWHGADWSFVIWGLYHGFFSILERMGFRKVLNKLKIMSVIYSFIVINFGWVLFRAENTLLGIRYISRMLFPWRHKDIAIETGNYLDRKTIFAFICAVIGIGILKCIIPLKIQKRWIGSVTEAIFCVCVLLLSIASIAGDTYNPFIYFQF